MGPEMLYTLREQYIYSFAGDSLQVKTTQNVFAGNNVGCKYSKY